MRNTDADWRIIAETEPYYGVCTNQKFMSANLDPEKVEEFYAGGVRDIDAAVQTLETLYGATSFNRALDFGCGVGRLTSAMAKRAKQVVGIDIAPRMLELAQARISDLGYTNVEFCAELPDGPFDWINSHIVFQHIPPERGYLILEDLLGRLDVGGVISVHFTLFRTMEQGGRIGRDAALVRWDGHTAETMIPQAPYKTGSMTMFDYDLGRLFAILTQHNITEVTLKHVPANLCQGAKIFGRRLR